MSFEIVDIDHYMIRVAHLQQGVRAFESLGFTVAPERKHVNLATAHDKGHKAPFNNRLIMLQGYPGRADVANFLELMCLETQIGLPTPVNQLMSFMWDTEGPKTIVCYTADMTKTMTAMQAAGLSVSLPSQVFESGWQDEERNIWVPLKARPCVPVFRQTAFMVNAYETETVGSFRYEPWTRHANSAKYLAGVLGISENIKTDVMDMAERVFGVEPKWESEDCAVLKPRDIYLRIVTPKGFSRLYPSLGFSTERILPALAGATIAVSSMQVARSTLRANDVQFAELPNGGIGVPRQVAANTVLEFVPAVE